MMGCIALLAAGGLVYGARPAAQTATQLRQSVKFTAVDMPAIKKPAIPPPVIEAPEVNRPVSNPAPTPAVTYAPTLGGDRYSAEINPYTGGYRYLTDAELWDLVMPYDKSWRPDGWDAALMFHIVKNHETYSLDTMAKNGIYEGLFQQGNAGEYGTELFIPERAAARAWELSYGGTTYSAWAH